jgi:ABC-type multidrug transport system fused ATPase/permease subunit
MRRIPLRPYWSLFAAYLRPHARQVALLAMLLLASIALQLLQPQIMRHFIDAARAGAPSATLLRVALLFLGVALVQQLAVLGTTYVGEDLGWKATNCASI